VRLRPLFILADLEAGGAQRVILTVLRHLNRSAFDPHLAIVSKSGPLVEEIPGNVRIHDLKIGRVRYALPSILMLCRSLRPETVVSTLGHLNLALLAGKPFFPRTSRLVVREANTPSLRLRHTKRPAMYGFLYRALYPLADRVICNSQYMRKDVLEQLTLRLPKTVIIPNPVDMERIEKKVHGGGNPYSDHQVERHLVAVGRLNYQKGFDLLLRAFKKSMEGIPNLHLTIVGDGPEAKSLTRLADRLGILEAVTFAGHQDNPYPFMAHADLLVSSSRWEGLPNVVLESLACGTPVLAFDCPGGTREIIRDGENGWLVPLPDLDAMSGRMVSVARGEDKLALTGGALLPSEYHCRNVVEKYERLLVSVRA
jgi:glycosyltransferase involved in cell wall biosynthesis